MKIIFRIGNSDVNLKDIMGINHGSFSLPIVGHTIRFKSDLDNLYKNNIYRVTMIHQEVMENNGNLDEVFIVALKKLTSSLNVLLKQ